MPFVILISGFWKAPMSPKDGGLISKGANEAIRVIRGLELSVLTQAWGGRGRETGGPPEIQFNRQ